MAKKRKGSTGSNAATKVRDCTEAENDCLGKLHAQIQLLKLNAMQAIQQKEQALKVAVAKIEAECERGQVQVIDPERPTFGLFQNTKG